MVWLVVSVVISGSLGWNLAPWKSVSLMCVTYQRVRPAYQSAIRWEVVSAQTS